MAENIPKDYSEYITSGRAWTPENSKSSVPDLIGNMHDVANFPTKVTADSPIVSGGLSDSLSLDSLAGSLGRQIELANPSVREFSNVAPSKTTAFDAFSSQELVGGLSGIMGDHRSTDELPRFDKGYNLPDWKDITDIALDSLPDIPVATFKEPRAPALQKLDNLLTPLEPIAIPTDNFIPPVMTKPYAPTLKGPADLPNRTGALTRLIDDGRLEGGQAFDWADKLRTGDIDLGSLQHIETSGRGNPYLTEN